MSDDRRRILEMLSQGKISVQDAEDLLKAMGGETGGPSSGAEEPKKTPRWLRIAVDKQIEGGGRKKEVTVRVPVSLVRAGVRLGGMMPRITGTRAGARLDALGVGDLGFDLSRIDPKQLEALINEMGEMVIDLDDGRAQVRITCE
jgi:hypothetical protein